MGDMSLPEPKWDGSRRMVYAAMVPNVTFSLLPVSMFGNSYMCVMTECIHVHQGLAACIWPDHHEPYVDMLL